MTYAGDIYCDGTYLAKNPTWHEADSPWKAARVVRLLRRNAVEFASFADLGCGVGAVLHELHLAYPAASFWGFDVSPEAIARAKRQQGDGLRFEVRGVEKIASHSFDVVSLLDVFEHVEDYMRLLRDAREVARQFVFHVPLDLSAQAVLRDKLMEMRRSVGHLHYFTKDTALATLTDTGYRVVDWFYTSPAIDMPKSLKARLAVLPRRLLFRANADFSAKLLGGFSIMVLAEHGS
jgi:SAM-dependent methyltransferase